MREGERRKTDVLMTVARTGRRLVFEMLWCLFGNVEDPKSNRYVRIYSG